MSVRRIRAKTEEYATTWWIHIGVIVLWALPDRIANVSLFNTNLIDEKIVFFDCVVSYLDV